MANWAGFTEADLERMKHGNDNTVKRSTQPKIVKPVQAKRNQSVSAKSKQPVQGKRTATTKRNNSASNVPTGALLSEPVTKAAPQPPQSIPAAEKILTTKAVDKVIPTTQDQEKEILTDDETIREKEKIKLEDVHQRQKQMEEKNRRKKEMLTKEIAERKKRAFAESHKLIKIQEELAKLDQLLNLDVSILRDKIDEACMEFSNAQKRFERAEAEYIAAKMDLHMRTSRKEDLTEHLYHLIQANEERKAKKLEELMNKLQVEEEDLEEKERERKSAESSTQDNSPTQPNISTPVTPQPDHGDSESGVPATEVAEPKATEPESESLHGANAIVK